MQTSSKVQKSLLQKKLTRFITEYAIENDGIAFHLVGTGNVAELEAKLAAHYGMKYALCISNATTGLFSLFHTLNLNGADFITTPCSYGASIAGPLLLNAKPIFADIESSTLTLNSQSVKERITTKTKAILAVDIFGHPSDSIALREIADEYGLWYIADCAQSFGAYRNGKPANYLADALVVSFTVGKSLFAGEGGAIVTDNTELYQKLIWLTQHPDRQRKDLSLQLVNEFSFNARIHPLAAVWANTVFETSMAKLKQHQTHCLSAIDALNEIGLTERINFAKQYIEPSFFRFSVAWKNAPQIERLEHELRAQSLRFQVGKNPVELLYKQSAFIAQYPRHAKCTLPCPQAERQAARRFCLLAEETAQNAH